MEQEAGRRTSPMQTELWKEEGQTCHHMCTRQASKGRGFSLLGGKEQA